MTREEAYKLTALAAIDAATCVDNCLRRKLGPGFKQTDGRFVRNLEQLIFEHLVRENVVDGMEFPRWYPDGCPSRDLETRQMPE